MVAVSEGGNIRARSPESDSVEIGAILRPSGLFS